jgi:hypothetical protein
VKKQKLITLSYYDGQYHNFFHSPGSQGSLSKLIEEGWLVVFIKEYGTPDAPAATVLMEKES